MIIQINIPDSGNTAAFFLDGREYKVTKGPQGDKLSNPDAQRDNKANVETLGNLVASELFSVVTNAMDRRDALPGKGVFEPLTGDELEEVEDIW